MRIISLIASATEIICSLGQKNNLVGISHECDYPKDIQNLPVCSLPRFDTSGSSLEVDRDVKSLIQSALSVYRINEDALKELKPDIIVTQSQCDVCAVSEKDVENALKNTLGIDPIIVSLCPKDIEDIKEDIKAIANALGIPDIGAEESEKFAKEIEGLASLEKTAIKPSVACIEWIEPLMYAGNWVPQMVEIAGGENIFSVRGEHSSWSDYDTLFRSNPDKIILMPCGYDLDKIRLEMNPLLDLPFWNSLNAVKTDNVFITDGNQYFNRPGPRLIDSIKILIEIISEEDNLFGFKDSGWERFYS